MSSEKDQGKKFSEEVDRLLAGQEPKVDQGADSDMHSTLDFARKMTSLRSSPSPEFKAQLQARLRQKLEAQEQKEPASGHSSWFRRFIPRSPVWQAATALLVMLMIFGITWSSGVFNHLGQTGVPAPSPSNGAIVTPAGTTAAATTSVPATTTTAPTTMRPTATYPATGPMTTTAAPTTTKPVTSAPPATAPVTSAAATPPTVTVTVTAPPITITHTASPAARFFDPNSGLYFNSQQELQNYQNAHPSGAAAPAPATPAYIWVIIGVGAVLIIIVIILIANARKI